MTQTVRIESLLEARVASFEAPFSMLEACHERVQRTLGLLTRLRGHLPLHGPDDDARQAARDILRYFDIAAPAHHQDEELHVFPVLLQHGPAELRPAVQQLQRDHERMLTGWRLARAVLLGIADGQWDPVSPAQDEVLAGWAALYAEHIRLEEAEVYPQARALLDASALAAMGHEMMRRRGAV